MKRLLGLFILVFLVNSCDDGKITIDNIDFSAISAQKCSEKDVLYKVNGNEMLILAIPSTTFIADQTPEGSPIEIPINSTNQVVYRSYAGAASSDNICPDIPSATPDLHEQWTGTSGTIQITSTAVKTVDPTTNATKITGYQYYIVFKNITFHKPNGDQIYETFVFGNYTASITPLAFGFDVNKVVKSTCDNRIFNFSGSEAFILDTADFDYLFENAVTTTPRTAVIGSDNKLTYKLFNNPVNDAYFCTPPTGEPALLQQWIAADGVEGANGIIEVTTTTLGTDFQHTIHFKKVTLKQGNSDFYLGDDYLFGSFLTN